MKKPVTSMRLEDINALFCLVFSILEVGCLKVFTEIKGHWAEV